MKLLRQTLLQSLLLIAFYSHVLSTPTPHGFSLPDSINEMTIRFKSVRNLIVLPFKINDSISVNLILDTGCRNLVLFGKEFKKLLNLSPGKLVEFSGLGSGAPVNGYLSLENKVSMQSITGERVPVVVVPDRNLFSVYRDVHGVIGYEIFLKFEIEINPREHTIKFRPAARATAPEGYAQVPLKIIDARPILSSAIQLTSRHRETCDLMIDTGSSIGLLLKTKDIPDHLYRATQNVIGRGFNGLISGVLTTAKGLHLQGFAINNVPAGIIQTDWQSYASIGMDILKDYVLVLNYCKSYACFKKLA